MPPFIIVSIIAIIALFILVAVLLEQEQREGEREQKNRERSEQERQRQKTNRKKQEQKRQQEQERQQQEQERQQQEADPVWQAEQAVLRSKIYEKEYDQFSKCIKALEEAHKRRGATFQRELAGYIIKDAQTYYVIACEMADADYLLGESVYEIDELREEIKAKMIRWPPSNGGRLLLHRLDVLDDSPKMWLSGCPNPGPPPNQRNKLPMWNEVENL